MFVKINHLIQAGDPGTSPRRQRGDTMIEVLVTIIVIAVGVLGAAALQITTLKNLSSSHSASIAAIVTDDFSERMRANPTAALADAYVHSEKPVFGAAKDCTAEACTPEELAVYDIEVWWTGLATLLPSPAVDVRRMAGTTFQLTVHWDEDRSGSTEKTCPPTSDTDLECYRFNVTI